jgi:hypothetical protein
MISPSKLGMVILVLRQSVKGYVMKSLVLKCRQVCPNVSEAIPSRLVMLIATTSRQHLVHAAFYTPGLRTNEEEFCSSSYRPAVFHKSDDGCIDLLSTLPQADSLDESEGCQPVHHRIYEIKFYFHLFQSSTVREEQHRQKAGRLSVQC